MAVEKRHRSHRWIHSSVIGHWSFAQHEFSVYFSANGVSSQVHGQNSSAHAIHMWQSLKVDECHLSFSDHAENVFWCISKYVFSILSPCRHRGMWCDVMRWSPRTTFRCTTDCSSAFLLISTFNTLWESQVKNDQHFTILTFVTVFGSRTKDNFSIKTGNLRSFYRLLRPFRQSFISVVARSIAAKYMVQV